MTLGYCDDSWTVVCTYLAVAVVVGGVCLVAATATAIHRIAQCTRCYMHVIYRHARDRYCRKINQSEKAIKCAGLALCSECDFNETERNIFLLF